MASPLDSIFTVFSGTLNFVSSVSVYAVGGLQSLKSLTVSLNDLVNGLKNIPVIGFLLNIILSPLSLIFSAVSSLIDALILLLNLVVPTVKKIVDSYPTSLFIIIGAVLGWFYIVYPQVQKMGQNGVFKVAEKAVSKAVTTAVSSIGFGFQTLQNSLK